MPSLPYNAPAGFDWVTCLENWSLDTNTLHVTARTAAGQQARLRFAAITPDVWRMTFLLPGVESALPTPIVVGNRDATVALSVEQQAQRITVTGPRLALQIDYDPWRISFLDSDGFDICRENPSDIDGLDRPFILPLGYVRSAEKALPT